MVTCAAPELLVESSVEPRDWKVAVPETLSAVVDAVPKYPVPDTESAVVDAYGKVLKVVAVEVMAPAKVEAVVEVEMKLEPMMRLPKMSPATERS